MRKFRQRIISCHSWVCLFWVHGDYWNKCYRRVKYIYICNGRPNNNFHLDLLMNTLMLDENTFFFSLLRSAFFCIIFELVCVHLPCYTLSTFNFLYQWSLFKHESLSLRKMKHPCEKKKRRYASANKKGESER